MRDPFDIFTSFAQSGGLGGEEGFENLFGGGSPLGGMGGRPGSFGRGGSSYGGRANGGQKKAAEATVLEKPIAFSLEE